MFRPNRKKFFDAARMQVLLKYLEEEDAKVCNCAGCEALLLSAASHEALSQKDPPKGVKLPSAVVGRIYNRPYGPCCHAAWKRATEYPHEHN